MLNFFLFMKQKRVLDPCSRRYVPNNVIYKNSTELRKDLYNALSKEEQLEEMMKYYKAEVPIGKKPLKEINRNKGKYPYISKKICWV